MINVTTVVRFDDVMRFVIAPVFPHLLVGDLPNGGLHHELWVLLHDAHLGHDDRLLARADARGARTDRRGGLRIHGIHLDVRGASIDFARF